MTTWFRVGFVHAMTHAVYGSLLASLVIDMASRRHPIEDFEKKYGREHAESLGGNPKRITTWAFDLGGMYFVGAPSEHVDIDGLDVEIDCDYFGSIYQDIAASKMRYFDDGAEYFKLKFWLHATVLSLKQRDSVLVQMESKLKRAGERATAFYEARRKAARSC